VSTETVNPFLTWAPPGKSLVIQLDHAVMDRMNIEVMRGFGVTRRRGTETGGLLLGKIDRKAENPVIYIQDFEVVRCEYAFGPSFVLSPADQQRFKEAVEKWQPSLDRELYAVGYFRSHTRDGFALDDRDALVFREFFPDPLDVALLVKPFATRPAIAGFFLKEKGALVTSSTPMEFKFETPSAVRESADEDNSPRLAAAPPKPASAPPPPPPPAPKPQLSTPRFPSRAESFPERDMFMAQTAGVSPWGRRLIWGAFYVALLAFGSAVGYEYAGRTLLKRNPAATGSSPAAGGLPNSDLYSIQLQTARVGDSVMVKWDRNASPIQAALHGILTVTEGLNSKDVKLGFAELRNGTAMYPIGSRETRFRLEIFFKDNRSFVESATYMNAGGKP
jgi:hypothetical protein